MGKTRNTGKLATQIQFDNSNNLVIGTSASSSFNTSGSVNAIGGITGSIFGIGNPTSFSSSISSDLTGINNFTASNGNASLNSFSASNSNTSLNAATSSYSKLSGGNTFSGTQIISGSTYVQGDLVVYGSSSIQYISASSVSIGTNVVQLNTANPVVRFAGLTMIDSGSVGGSGSFLYDSVHDEFIFVHRGNGTNVTSSHFVTGPETYDNLGNELYLTCNVLTKGTGKEHLVDSCIFDNGTTTCIKNNLVGTGTISGTTIYGSTTVCSPVGYFSGCVNIGTTGSEKLNIFGAGSQYINIKNTTSGADMFVGMSSGLAAAYIGTGGTDPVVFVTANTERMRIASNGNVGIGTTSPDPYGFGYTSLTIRGGTYAGAAGMLHLITPTTDTNGQILGQINFNDGVNLGAVISSRRETSNTTSNIQFYTNNAGTVAERMRITSAGTTCFAGTVCAPLFTTTNGVAAIGAGPSSTEIFTATGPSSSNGMYLIIYSQQGTAGSATGMAYLNIWNNASVDVFNIFCQSLSNVTNSGTSIRIQTLSGNGGFTAVYSVIRLR
jgi:hypothetical protein